MSVTTQLRIATEHVVLLDERGRPAGTVPKERAHGMATPFHLAFSCHLVDAEGRVLLTRRSLAKRTWPGVWTNGCCGHPQMGETLREAVGRRVAEELGLRVVRAGVAVPDFAYRAAMPDGIVEHELCPVVVAQVDGMPLVDPDEVVDLAWVSWDELRHRACTEPDSLSPWSVEQIAELAVLAPDPRAWLHSREAGFSSGLLDEPVGAPQAVDALPVVPRDDGALAVVRGPVRARLEGFVRRAAATTMAVDPVLGEVTDEIQGLVAAGGKRLRPAFVYWGHRATGAAHDDAVLGPAAAVELLHTFALLHDDVMDRSARRRGRPSAHAALATEHRSRRRLGDADWFGASAAILAGDLAFVWADELFDATALPSDAMTRARAVFTSLRREVIAGQYLDLVLAADRAAHEETARHVALLKSARYTVTRPLLLGAALAPEGDGLAAAPALQAYGDAVGIAFQMRDDVLGLFGDPEATGKGRLDDLREGKRTLLVLRALRLADEHQRQVLLACLGDPEIDDSSAAAARDAVAASGALASVEALIAALHATALRAIEGLPAAARDALTELADLSIRRAT